MKPRWKLKKMSGGMTGMNQPAVLNQRAWALFTDLANRLVFDLGHDISSLFGPFKL